MADFRKPRFGGGERRGGFRGGSRPSFGERKELFQATCSNCHKECEVPFRPNGTKPVFCKDCFVRPENDAPRSFDRRDAPRPSFDRRDDRRDDRRPSFDAAPKAAIPDPRIDVLKRDIETLTRKVESIIDLIRGQQLHETIEKATKSVKTVKTAPAKPVAKKAKKK